MDRDTVLLIEDEDGLREFIQMYLTEKGYDVVTAGDGKEGLDIIDTIKPNIVLLDIEMPRMDGFTVCKEIRKKMTVPILFISCRKDVMDKIKCFELGGDDYLTKPFNFAELEVRIQANLRQYRETPLTEPKVIKQGDMEIDTERLTCFVEGRSTTLAAKEMKLLLLLANHPNQIWSAEQLYDQVWGFDHMGDVSTVKVHISRLRSKLERNPAEPEYIQTVRGFGYLFAAD